MSTDSTTPPSAWRTQRRVARWTGVAVALVVGFPILRTNRHAFVISTLTFALLVALLIRGRERARVAGVSAVAEPVPNNYLVDLPRWRQAFSWNGQGWLVRSSSSLIQWALDQASRK